ncbi:MAG TPA: hypothetical protein VNZ85_15265 [Caulobacter sp.]|nr:hypothetical protein [Caulobacter sp.]
MIVLAAAAQLASSTGDSCTYEKGESLSQQQLPEAIGADLRLRVPGMSPEGGPFLATDVGEGPRTRFISAARLGNRYVVAYERGGRGYNIQILSYTLASSGLASLTNQRTTFEKPVCGAIAAALTAP